MEISMNKSRFPSLIIALTILSLACSSFPSLPGSGGIDSTCRDIGLAAQESVPGDVINVTGLEGGGYALRGEMREFDRDQPFPVFVPHLEEGSYGLVAPLHPENPLEGGQVEITILNGEQRCGTVNLTITPLPEAPGAFRDYLGNLESRIQQELVNTGIGHRSLDEISPEEVDRYFPLLLARELLMGEGNPNAVFRILDGSAADYSLTEQEIKILDGMTAHLGLVEDSALTGTSAAGLQSPGQIPNNAIGTQTELHKAMVRQSDCEGRITGASNQVLSDAGLAAAGVGVISGGAGLLLSGGLVGHQLYTEYCAYRLPAQITDISFDVSKASFPEDYDQGPDRFYNVKAKAVSKTWNPSQVIIDALLSAGGAIKWLKSTGSLQKVGGNFVNQLNEIMASVTNNICARSAQCKDDLSVDLTPIPYGPVDLQGEEWIKGDIRPGPEVAFRMETYNSFRAIDDGSSVLAVQTADGKFGSQTYEGTQVLTVRRIIVTVSPAAVEAKPKEKVCFNGEVENADDEGLDWFVDGPDYPHTLMGHSDGGSGPHFCFEAPDWDLDPPQPCEQPEKETRVYAIEARSTANTGPRKNSSEPRLDIATLTVVKEPDEDQQLPPPSCSEQLPPCHWRATASGNHSGAYSGDNARFFSTAGNSILTLYGKWGIPLSQSNESSENAELQLYSGSNSSWIFSPGGDFEEGLVGPAGDMVIHSQSEDALKGSFRAELWFDPLGHVKGTPPDTIIAGIFNACPGGDIPQVIPGLP